MNRFTHLRVAVLLVALSLSFERASAQQTATIQISPEANAHLAEIVAALRKEWLYRDTMDWNAFSQQVMARANGAQTIPDTYDAIRLALTLLDDRHSYYRTSLGQVIWNPESPTQSTGACTPPPFDAPNVPSTVGYLRIQVTPPTPPDSIQAVLRRNRTLDRWIIDLRNSRGGNMWPILAGVGPLLGADTVGYFVDATGQAIPWGYSDGNAWLNGKTVVAARSPVALMQNVRVAVLTDIGVASSGEAIAIAFRARPNARSFGTPTCGLSTAVGETLLSNGAGLGIVGAAMADRKKRQYRGRVLPDELITKPADAVKRALEWLNDPAPSRDRPAKAAKRGRAG